MEPISLGIGASIALVFYALGRTQRKSKSQEDVCQCKHGPNYHDKDGCHADDGYFDYEYHKWHPKPCRCKRYVGPYSSYVPELEG